MATGTNGIATVADVLSISGVTVSGSYTSSQCVKYSDIKGVSWPKSAITFTGDLSGYQSDYEGNFYVESDYTRDLIGGGRISCSGSDDSCTDYLFMPVDDISISISTGYMLVDSQADEFRIRVGYTDDIGNKVFITEYQPTKNTIKDITSYLRANPDCQYMVELPGSHTAVKVYRPIIVYLYAIG